MSLRTADMEHCGLSALSTELHTLLPLLQDAEDTKIVRCLTHLEKTHLGPAGRWPSGSSRGTWLAPF